MKSIKSEDTSVWDGFDAGNMTDEQRNLLLADMYGGYKETGGPEIFEMRGAGDGRAKVGTGRYSTNYDYYKDHPGWSGVAGAADITSINNKTDLGQMADYVSHYGKDKDNNQEVTAPETEADENRNMIATQLSRRSAEANAGINAFENNYLTKQGLATIGRNSSPVQDFKNAYQDNLTEELKVKDPASLATSKAKYELADKQAADIADNFSLSLGSSPSSKEIRFS
jgi:hypothetical protein